MSPGFHRSVMSSSSMDGWMDRDRVTHLLASSVQQVTSRGRIMYVCPLHELPTESGSPGNELAILARSGSHSFRPSGPSVLTNLQRGSKNDYCKSHGRKGETFILFALSVNSNELVTVLPA